MCPACFAREIDPVFLHFDPEDGGEFYCQQCGYSAKTGAEVEEFFDEIIWRRYRIRRRRPGSEMRGANA